MYRIRFINHKKQMFFLTSANPSDIGSEVDLSGLNRMVGQLIGK